MIRMTGATTTNSDGDEVTFGQWMDICDEYMVSQGQPARLSSEQLLDKEFMAAWDAANEEAMNYADAILKIDHNEQTVTIDFGDEGGTDE